jgi:hypothetical protein
MTDAKPMTSNRPYLIRAMYDWIAGGDPRRPGRPQRRHPRGQ